jgi:hypothetical protein
MFKKFLSATLIALLINIAALNPANARAQGNEQAHQIERVKEQVRRMGLGQEARVEVKLRGGRKLKGYISEATDDHFLLVDADGNPTRVTYPEVESIKEVLIKQGASASSSGVKKLAIGVALVGGIFLVSILLLKETK